MQKRFVIATVVIVFFLLLGLGSVLSERCVDVGGCKQCWKTIPTVVESDLCTENRTCLAQPADQQNNAIADALLCACSHAKSTGYGDQQLNSKIEDVISQYTRYNVSAAEACEQPGLFLVKRNYG